MPIFPISYEDPEEYLYFMLSRASCSSSSSWKETSRMPEKDMLGRIAVGGYGYGDVWESIAVGVGDCV